MILNSIQSSMTSNQSGTAQGWGGVGWGGGGGGASRDLLYLVSLITDNLHACSQTCIYDGFAESHFENDFAVIFLSFPSAVSQQ